VELEWHLELAAARLPALLDERPDGGAALAPQRREHGVLGAGDADLAVELLVATSRKAPLLALDQNLAASTLIASGSAPRPSGAPE
jgi:hypothetical protein